MKKEQRRAAHHYAGLLNCLCMKKADYVTEKLDALERIWNDYQIYSNDEINMVDDEVAIRSIEN